MRTSVQGLQGPQHKAPQQTTASSSTVPAQAHVERDRRRLPIRPPADRPPADRPPAETLPGKQAINRPADEAEQEAERMAARISNLPEPQLQRACPCGGGCPRCDPGSRGRAVGRAVRLLPGRRGLGRDTGQVEAPPIVHDILRSPGHPLDPTTRAFMERRFHHDFAGVRLHTDSRAAESARAVHALAFTVGQDVVFGAGQHAPQTGAGRRLLAHELTHVVQQASHTLLQRQPDPVVDEGSVEACLKQTKDLLPARVGVLEAINRDALLDEALGQERQHLEGQIRAEYDARKFVCEAGVPAMVALFYNRDYHNRLLVDRAREDLARHPEFYSSAGVDRLTRTKALLSKKYRIAIEPGDKAWSPEDIGLLAEALGTLTDGERPLIAGYRFIRWTNRCNQLVASKPGYECELEDYSICGLQLPDVIRRDYTITIYDCFKGDPEETLKKGYAVQPGAEAIIHEIGHAIETGKLRLALERQGDAKREYLRLGKLAAAATGTAKASLDQQVAEAGKVKDQADKDVAAAMSPSVLDRFIALTRGKPPLTPYSRKNATEAFAEAFMLFKVAPETLKKANKPLFDWFAKGGFL